MKRRKLSDQGKDKEMPNLFSLLPRDILVKIFNQVPSTKIIKIYKMCKLFYKILPYCIRSLPGFDKSHTSGYWKNLEAFPNYEHLSVEGEDDVKLIIHLC